MVKGSNCQRIQSTFIEIVFQTPMLTAPFEELWMYNTKLEVWKTYWAGLSFVRLLPSPSESVCSLVKINGNSTISFSYWIRRCLAPTLGSLGHSAPICAWFTPFHGSGLRPEVTSSRKPSRSLCPKVLSPPQGLDHLELTQRVITLCPSTSDSELYESTDCAILLCPGLEQCLVFSPGW